MGVEVLNVRRLCADANVVGFDLVELHPALDATAAEEENAKREKPE
jgi:arginase family enzyme